MEIKLKERVNRGNKSYMKSFEYRKKLSAAKQGKPMEDWQGFHKMKEPSEETRYVRVPCYVDGIEKNLLEQRLSWYGYSEELFETDVVHHIDGNPKNNDILNLCLFDSIHEHNLYHRDYLKGEKPSLMTLLEYITSNGIYDEEELNYYVPIMNIGDILQTVSLQIDGIECPLFGTKDYEYSVYYKCMHVSKNLHHLVKVLRWVFNVDVSVCFEDKVDERYFSLTQI